MASDHTRQSGNACAKCGACTTVCPVYLATGRESLTARGRLHLLDKIPEDRQTGEYRDIFSKCLLCKACSRACPREIDLPAMVVESRRRFPVMPGEGRLMRTLIGKCLPNHRILAGIGKLLRISEPLLARLPPDSGLRLKLGLAGPQEHRKPSAGGLGAGAITTAGKTEAPTGTLLFTGCFAAYLDKSIAAASVELVNRKENGAPQIPPAQSCCGLAFYSNGQLKEARRLARLNIKVFEESSAPIVVLCGSCFSHLAAYPELLADDDRWRARATAFAERLREFSTFLINGEPPAESEPKSPAAAYRKKAVYHDPCHLRHRAELKRAPRLLLDNLPTVELVAMPNSPKCCGFGGLFNLAHPDLSKRIAESAIEDILAAEPDLVITTCTGCLIQLRHHLALADSGIRVLHLAEVLTGSTS
ncbi:MAG: (Fe-S)-binding protein [Desulfurivibrionaceae bacterium]